MKKRPILFADLAQRYTSAHNRIASTRGDTISKNSHRLEKRLEGDIVLLVASDDHNLLMNYNILSDDVTSSHPEFLHRHFDHDKICALNWRPVRQ